MKVNELPRFKHRSTGEIVNAGKIAFMAKDDMNNTLMVHANPDNLSQIIEVPMNYLHSCNPVVGGYFVANAEDNLAYLHPSEFHIVYSSVDDEPEIDLEAADFSDALMWLKDGKRVARAGWNGKGQFVEIWVLPASTTWPGTNAPMQPCFVLANAQGLAQPGWVPSIGDLMASDWQVVN